MSSSTGIPPPKGCTGFVLAIQGVKRALAVQNPQSLTHSQLPDDCNSKHGWRLVKDLLRAILAWNNMLEPLYGKPGMVHIRCEDGIYCAYCNMKSYDAAQTAYCTIAGNLWNANTLAAAVFPGSSEEALWESGVPVLGFPPVELTEVFNIGPPGRVARSKAKTNASIAKGSRRGTSSKKRPVLAHAVQPARKRCASKFGKTTVSCPPFNRLREQHSPPPQCTSSDKLENQHCGLRLGIDEQGRVYEHYQADASETSVEHEQSSVKRVDGPLILDGTI